MVSIIIPTYNESGNILKLISSIEAELSKAGMLDYEILVMDDDSPDGTCEIVRGLNHKTVTAINRRGKQKGLSHAVIDGIGRSRGEIVGVMDADLSHPPHVIPSLIEEIKRGANLAVGSRYVPGGGISNWPLKRRASSSVACALARVVTSVQDSTSGFFFFRKEILDGVNLNPLGFKIGLEVFVKGRHGNKVTELPYVFTDRKSGQSKLSMNVIGCYLLQVLFLLRYKWAHSGLGQRISQVF